MYNKDLIDKLVKFINDRNGINDKVRLANEVKAEFNLTQDRSVFYSDFFAIRFSQSKQKRMGNTILSLSALQKYDEKPVFVCIVTPTENHIVLINTTFLKKVSHSSQALRIDNIRGSINGSDIEYNFNGTENIPENFQSLFATHSEFSFEENLERLVEATNSIAGRVPRLIINENQMAILNSSVDRANNFVLTQFYDDLNNDLCDRVNHVKGEIAIAATYINNVNIRGRVIEYLITENNTEVQAQLINSLRSHSPLPSIKTFDDLGDYAKKYDGYDTKTDIKTKVLYLGSNPKGYNIDKMLNFLSTDNSVYMLYLIGIDECGYLTTKLISVFDKRLIDITNTVFHWAGRNSRGVTQFYGDGLKDILFDGVKSNIDRDYANRFLTQLIDK